jgi:hypothetical protein
MEFRNFIPIRLYRYGTFFRLQKPYRYDNGFLFREDEPFLSYYTPVRTFYVLNPSIQPPIPRGCQLFVVHQRKEYPYSMISIEPNLFTPHQPHTDSYFFFIAYIVPIPRGIPLVYENTYLVDGSDRFVTYVRLYDQPSKHVPYAQKPDYRVLFVTDRPFLYWSCNSEACCVPSDDPHDFPRLMDCQTTCYPRVRNKTTYVGTSSERLYDLLSRP